VPCDSTPADAIAVIDRFGIDVPKPVRDHLLAADEPAPAPDNNSYRMIASPAQALKAAASMASELGYTPLILGDSLEGESRELGRTMAGIARSVQTLGEPVRAPAVLLSGGETTVTIGTGGAGRGGRNTEFLLALAIDLEGEPGIWALAGDSESGITHGPGMGKLLAQLIVGEAPFTDPRPFRLDRVDPAAYPDEASMVAAMAEDRSAAAAGRG
jgi:glycerate-2-kinase